MLFSQQALGHLSSSGAITVTVPLLGLATQALLSLKVDVISPCARILPDGGAAPRRSFGTTHGCHGCLLASSSKASRDLGLSSIQHARHPQQSPVPQRVSSLLRLLSPCPGRRDLWSTSLLRGGGGVSDADF